MGFNIRKTYILPALFLIGVAAASTTIFYLINLSQGTHTYSYTNDANETVGYIDCFSIHESNTVFTPNNSLSFTHEVRLSINENKIDKIFYVFEDTYADKDGASLGNAIIHGKYNNYIAINSIDKSKLHSTFSVIDNISKATIYASFDDLTASSAIFFYINHAEFQKFKTLDIGGVISFYQDQDFSCQSSI